MNYTNKQLREIALNNSIDGAKIAAAWLAERQQRAVSMDSIAETIQKRVIKKTDMCDCGHSDIRGTEGFEAFKEALQSAPPAAVSVPDGWKLVPTDSTPEMDAAGRVYIQKWGSGAIASDVWDTMLAATPAQSDKS